MMKYKGYIGIFEFEEKSQLFRGRVENIEDLVIFQGKSVIETQEAFKDAVNEYIAWCKKYRKEDPHPHSLLKEKDSGKNKGDNG